jgi:competence protein ComFC
MQFDTVRPEIAELLYRLKNRADKDAAGPIIETAPASSLGIGTSSTA